MPAKDLFILCLIVGAFGLLAVALAYADWQNGRSKKRQAAAKKLDIVN